MPTISQIIVFRNQHRNQHTRHSLGKLGLSLALLTSIFIVFVSLAGAMYYADLTRNLPSMSALPVLLEPPNGTALQPTRIYDRTHQHILMTLQNPAAVGRRVIKVGQGEQASEGYASRSLVDATIATFEPGFWHGSGYSLDGLLDGTHSTLAQKLISDQVLDAEPPSVQRNIRERLLAAQATETYGHRKILEWYLNSTRYGELIYGADAAAQVYFGISAADLSLAQSAVLTALAGSPNMDPYTDPRQLRDQQERVLLAMVAHRFISYKDSQAAFNEQIVLRPPVVLKPFAAAFIALVLEQAAAEIPLEHLQQGGYEIISSLDYNLQVQAECAKRVQLERVTINQPGPGSGDVFGCEAAQLLPNLKVDQANLSSQPRAEVAILDPTDGQILALVGEDSFSATTTKLPEHTAGTILAPFLYLSAFTRGMSPATLLWDIPPAGAGGSDGTGTGQIQPPPGEYHGPVRIRTAFVNDYQAAAESVLQQVGLENITLVQKQFGLISAGFDLYGSARLSDFYSQPISLLSGVYAYSVFANHGILAGQSNELAGPRVGASGLNANAVLEVRGVDGRVWLDRTAASYRTIISPQLAYLETNILSDNTARFPSLGHPNALEIDRPAAVKAGITTTGEDAWTIGYTPQLVAGVWMGYSSRSDEKLSVDFPAGLWHALLEYASHHMPAQDFTIPAGISRVKVCDPSGLLVTNLCPSIVQEIFLSGQEPTQEDNLYKQYIVNRETGLLATIFTPSDMQEEKVLMDVPAQALGWARQAGVPLPPSTYDTIPAPGNPLPDVQITAPQTFDHIAGEVKFFGTAAGDGFEYYRLQIGKGLNPQEWLQLGEDIKQPVTNGLLGTWDTFGLEGLYVVQLLVVRQSQQVEQAILQVTLDNTPPQVQVLSPQPEEVFSLSRTKSIMLQVKASDNLELDKLEFYIDGMLETTRWEPPYVFMWTPRSGGHLLLVKAYDLAGNSSDSSQSFSVQK